MPIDYPTVVVQIGGSNPNAPGVKTVPGLRAVEVRLTSGSTPSTARLLWEAPKDDQAGPVFTDAVGVSDPIDGFAPSTFSVDDTVKITSDGITVFIGQISRYGWKSSPNRGSVFEIECEDARAYFLKMPLRGRAINDIAGSSKWIEASSAIFQERGLDNLEFINSSEVRPLFCISEIVNNGGIDTNSAPWTLLNVLAYIRSVFDSSWSLDDGDKPADDLQTWTTRVTWPDALIAAGFTGGELLDLHQDPTNAELNITSDLDLTGISLAGCIDAVLGRGSKYSWTLRQGGTKPELVVYDKLNGSTSGTTQALDRGTIDANVQDGIPAVTGLDLFVDNARTYTQVIVVGGQHRIQGTFSTTGTGVLDTGPKTLAEGWSSSEESNWYTQTKNGNIKQANRAYPWVLRRYVIPTELNWSKYFPDFGPSGDGRVGSTKYVRDSKRVLRTLLDSRDDETNIVGQKIREPILVQRRLNGNSTWDAEQTLPGTLSVLPLPDGGGVVLSQAVRRKDFIRFPGDSPLPWTWDGDTAPSSPVKHDVRITCVVLADERLLARTPTMDESLNPRALYVDARDQFWMEAMVKASIRDPDDSTKLIEVGTEDFPELVRDDRKKAEALADRMFDELNRHGVGGTIRTWGIRPEVQPGDKISTLDSSGRDTITLNAIVTEVLYEFDGPSTIIQVTRN